MNSLNTSSHITVMENNKTRRVFLKGQNMSEGDRPEYEVIEAVYANKQRQRDDKQWEDDTKTETRFDRETKKMIDVTYTPISYNLVMIDADESIKCPKVLHINMQSDTAVERFEALMGEKLDKNSPRGSTIESAIGMKIAFERINNDGFPPSVLPVV